ncbi:MAG TPA: PIN domain-containing protein [Tepidisphaeraceae bacterium]|jgi:predicted nucleic acid-binding protein|nr:PIN domain-containing protein [Tepidisphaeraceae bacterium]
MAAYLLDTNVVLRIADRGDAEHAVAFQAVATLLARGDKPVITPQVLIEFWAVASRPVLSNGLGWDSQRIADAQRELLIDFRLLQDLKEIFAEWQALVLSHRVQGKQVHDAGLAAVVRCYGHQHIVTFNPSDFVRFSGLVVVHPNELAAQVP